MLTLFTSIGSSFVWRRLCSRSPSFLLKAVYQPDISNINTETKLSSGDWDKGQPGWMMPHDLINVQLCSGPAHQEPAHHWHALMWDAGLPLPGTRGDRGRHPDPEAMELQEKEAEPFSHAKIHLDCMYGCPQNWRTVDGRAQTLESESPKFKNWLSHLLAVWPQPAEPL